MDDDDDDTCAKLQNILLFAKMNLSLVLSFLGSFLIYEVLTQCRPPSPSEHHESRRLTRALYHHVKLWQISPSLPGGYIPTYLVGPQNRSFSLLETAAQIAKTSCPDIYVSHDFTLDGALKAFSVLRGVIFGNDKRSNGYFRDMISVSLYQRIHPILISCQRKILTISEKLRFESDDTDGWCPSGLIRKICYDDNEGVRGEGEEFFVCKDLELRNVSSTRMGDCPERNANIILDVVWLMVDLVHGLCLKEFLGENDLTAYHIWEQAMESLFSKQILDYWYKSDLMTEEYQLLLHPLPTQQLYNLEMCVEGIYYLSNRFRVPRLTRPGYSSERVFRRFKRSGDNF